MPPKTPRPTSLQVGRAVKRLGASWTGAKEQEQAASVLFRASLEDAQKDLFAFPGAVDALLKRCANMQGTTARAREACTLALANLADDEDLARRMVEEHKGLLPALCDAVTAHASNGEVIDAAIIAFTNLVYVAEIADLAMESEPRVVQCLAHALTQAAHGVAKYGVCSMNVWLTLMSLSRRREHRPALARVDGLVQLAVDRLKSEKPVPRFAKLPREALEGMARDARQRAAMFLSHVADHPENETLLREWPGLMDACVAVRAAEEERDIQLAGTAVLVLHRLHLAREPRVMLLEYTTRTHIKPRGCFGGRGEAFALGIAIEEALAPEEDSAIPVKGEYDPDKPDKVIMQGRDRVEMRLIVVKVEPLVRD